MSGHASGGNDTFTVSSPNNLFNIFYGDAGSNMSDHAQGGNDTFNDSVVNGSRAVGLGSTFYGDAGGDMSDHAHGGNDTFATTGLHRNYLFYGDAGGTMGDKTVGGDDTYVGGNVTHDFRFPLINQAYGDALTMTDNAEGGNDTLIGGNGGSGGPEPFGTIRDVLVGDAQTMSGNARGGNDKLISGTTGNEDMWGDAQIILGNAKGGDDTFVFAANNGQDKIEDLGQGVQGVSGSNWGVDHIDVTALGIHDFGQLNISAFDPNAHESTMTFSPGNEVVVHSQVALSAHDFILAA